MVALSETRARRALIALVSLRAAWCSRSERREHASTGTNDRERGLSVELAADVKRRIDPFIGEYGRNLQAQ